MSSQLLSSRKDSSIASNVSALLHPSKFRLPFISHLNCDNSFQLLFLANLSVLDTLYTSVTSPTLLAGLLAWARSISFSGCLTQLFLFLSLGSSVLRAYTAHPLSPPVFSVPPSQQLTCAPTSSSISLPLLHEASP